MTSTESFSDFIQRLREGDRDEAAVEVFERFTARLIALARGRLSSRLKQKEDPEDVVQSAYRSFFRKDALGELELETWQSIWGLLTVITLRKCCSRVNRFYSVKRDVQREFHPESATEKNVIDIAALDSEPTPVEAATMEDTVEQLMRALDEREQPILSLTLQGYNVREVSDQVGLSERTVQRVRQSIRNKLEGMIDVPREVS